MGRQEAGLGEGLPGHWTAAGEGEWETRPHSHVGGQSPAPWPLSWTPSPFSLPHSPKPLLPVGPVAPTPDQTAPWGPCIHSHGNPPVCNPSVSLKEEARLSPSLKLPPPLPTAPRMKPPAWVRLPASLAPAHSAPHTACCGHVTPGPHIHAHTHSRAQICATQAPTLTSMLHPLSLLHICSVSSH